MSLVAALAGAALLSVLLRLPFLSVPLTADEAGYAYVAHWMARGAVLYRDLWFDRPQAIFGLYGAIFAALGPSVEAIRAAAAVYNAATTVAVGALGSRLFGRPAGAAAALAFAAGSAAPAVEGFTANGELFMNLPALGSLLLAHAGRPFAAGALLSLAAAVKPTALPSAAPAAAALLLTAYAGRGAGRDRRAAVACAAAGGLTAAAPFALHGIVEGGAAAYWYAVAGFRLEAHSAFSAGSRFVDELRQTGPHVFFGLLPLWLLCGWWACRALRHGCVDRRWMRGEIAALLYLGGSLAGAALGGYWYWHYFAGVLPALALGVGAVAPVLATAHWAPRRHAVVAAGACAALAVAVAYNLGFVGRTPEETSWRLYRNDGYVVGREVAAYLRERTAPDDTVFAAFSQPDLYYLSGRRSAGAHLYWTEINRVPGALDAVLGAIDDPRRCPKYVVRVQAELERPGRAAAFWDRVERRFEPEAAIGGLVIYRRIGD